MSIQMDIQSLPQELVIYIYTFSVTHRALWNAVLEQLQAAVGHKKGGEYISSFEDSYEDWPNGFGDFLHHKCVDRDGLFTALTKCRCCPRHLHNRPKNLYTGRWDETSSTEQTWDENCDCSCRHISRTLCRVERRCSIVAGR